MPKNSLRSFQNVVFSRLFLFYFLVIIIIASLQMSLLDKGLSPWLPHLPLFKAIFGRSLSFARRHPAMSASPCLAVVGACHIVILIIMSVSVAYFLNKYMIKVKKVSIILFINIIIVSGRSSHADPQLLVFLNPFPFKYFWGFITFSGFTSQLSIG